MLQEIAESTGIEPPSLKNRPVLDVYQTYITHIHSDLSFDRPSSGGMGGVLPIPLSVFQQYADFWGFATDEKRMFWESVRVYDTLWLSEVQKRQENSSK